MTETTKTQTTITYGALTPSMKKLCAKLGKRSKLVRVVFHAGPVTLHGAWSTGAVSFGNLRDRKVTHWTGSDGESNTSVEEIWDAATSREVNVYNRRGSVPRVEISIGNVCELLPAEGAKLTTEDLLTLEACSAGITYAHPAQAVETTFAEPGPFNDLTATVETGRKVIAAYPDPATEVADAAAAEHNAMLAQLGID